MQIIKEYNWSQISFLRIIFGIYLFCHFTHLLLFSTELLSSVGIIANANMNLTFGFFPNILYLLNDPISIKVFLGILVVSALGFMLNKYPKVCAITLWYGFACVFHRNNFIANPSIFYVGWLLLAFIFLPNKKDHWMMPKVLFDGAWFITGLSYTISGFHKMTSPSWISGKAIYHLIDNPLARDSFWVNWLADLPMPIFQILTWSTLALEVLALPMILFRPTRKYLWLGLLGLHLGILTTVNFTDLTLGMLMFHMFIFDPRWLKPKTVYKTIVHYDSNCGVCNGFVKFIIANNQQKNIYFKPLKEGETIIVEKNEQILTHSKAIIAIFQELDGLLPMIASLKYSPLFVRDSAYKIFAKYRHKIFKLKYCEIPRPEERQRFI